MHQLENKEWLHCQLLQNEWVNCSMLFLLNEVLKLTSLSLHWSSSFDTVILLRMFSDTVPAARSILLMLNLQWIMLSMTTTAQLAVTYCRVHMTCNLTIAVMIIETKIWCSELTDTLTDIFSHSLYPSHLEHTHS